MLDETKLLLLWLNEGPEDGRRGGGGGARGRDEARVEVPWKWFPLSLSGRW